MLNRGFQQNINADFSLSKREIHSRNRFMNKSVFYRTLPNGSTQLRSWLIYSKSATAVFCGPCKLFGESQVLTAEYSDWSNAHHVVKDHEESKTHKSNVIAFLQRSKSEKNVHVQLEKQINDEIQYWQNVLKRVVAVIKVLSSRGLPFRGDDERFGSLHNGNYMMVLELISEFDPFLAEHIRLYGNAGKGSTSYLSKTICNEFIEIMANQVTQKIVSDIIAAKYFSISADSTPDLSHVDQLSFVIRNVDETGFPRERFIKFIPNSGHKAEELAEVVLSTLEELKLDIKNCRGQSYDNASNMSGGYSGLQARIKEVNRLADYIPCSAHSLNLVGTYAAECCSLAVQFYFVLQQLSNFFSASTHRWEILILALKSKSKSLKSLSQTRWSARHDACESLRTSYPEIVSTLHEIAEDLNEKSLTRSEALGLYNSLATLEIYFIALFWSDISETRF